MRVGKGPDRRPGPGPARPVIFLNHGPRSGPARETTIPPAVGPARSNPTRKTPSSLVACPAWPARFSERFHSSLFVSSPSTFRGRNEVTRAHGFIWAVAHCPQSMYTKLSLTCPCCCISGLRIPWGAALVTQQRLEQALLEPGHPSRTVTSVFIFPKPRKMVVVIRTWYCLGHMNRGNKNRSQ